MQEDPTLLTSHASSGGTIEGKREVGTQHKLQLTSCYPRLSPAVAAHLQLRFRLRQCRSFQTEPRDLMTFPLLALRPSFHKR